jgi:hypothetical protein
LGGRDRRSSSSRPAWAAQKDHVSKKKKEKEQKHNFYTKKVAGGPHPVRKGGHTRLEALECTGHFACFERRVPISRHEQVYSKQPRKTFTSEEIFLLDSGRGGR